MRFIKKCLIAILLLVALWLGLAASKWLPRPNNLQLKSLAILRAPRTTAIGRRNAFAALWLSHYDIPATDMESVANADINRYLAPALDSKDAFVSSAEGHYRKEAFPEVSSRAMCASYDENCLSIIRRNAGAVRASLNQYPMILAHARALSAYDYYQDRFQRNTNSVFASRGIGFLDKLLIGDAALRFVDGDKSEGLLRACAAASTMRHFALHSDSLITQVVSASWYDGASSLVAEMLAELPADETLPSECGTAFAPIPDDALSICDAMKTEFQIYAATLRQISSPTNSNQLSRNDSRFKDASVRLLYNSNASVALLAPGFASYCTQDADVQRESERMDTATYWQVCGVQGDLFNPIGCILLSLPKTKESYAKYPLRMRNMQLMNTLLNAALASRISAKIASTAGPSDEHAAVPLPPGVTLDANAHQLRIRRAYHRSGDSPNFTIPMPASRMPDVGSR
ncbi:MAG: hypothetical protein ABI365_06395 [Lysobacteraceae bacterium]